MSRKKLTILGAITKVLNEHSFSMSSKQIYNSIVEKQYYKFKAQNPYSVVRVELRRHCNGIDFPTSSPKKYFQIFNDGTYSLLTNNLQKESSEIHSSDLPIKKENIDFLKSNYEAFKADFRNHILDQLKSIEPDSFEIFCKKLLTVYGFQDLRVTKKTRDGGIDGEGKLKVGIYFSECCCSM